MKTVVLADCPNGQVVRLGGRQGRWGVVCNGGVRRTAWCVVDFWDGGRERVPSWTVVEVQS